MKNFKTISYKDINLILSKEIKEYLENILNYPFYSKNKIINKKFFTEDIMYYFSLNKYLIEESKKPYIIKKIIKSLSLKSKEQYLDYLDHKNIFNSTSDSNHDIRSFMISIEEVFFNILNKHINDNNLMEIYQIKVIEKEPKLINTLKIGFNLQEKIIKSRPDLIKYIHNINIKLQNKYKYLILSSKIGIFDDD